MQQQLRPRSGLTRQILTTTNYPQIIKVVNEISDNNFRIQFSNGGKLKRQEGLTSHIDQTSTQHKLQNIVLKNLENSEIITEVVQKIRKYKLDSSTVLYFEADEGPQWQDFLEHVLQSSCHLLAFFCSRLKFINNIRKVVSMISFPQLEVIRFYDCPIQNIEVISFLDAPKLSEIQFVECKVINFKSMVKTCFKNLRKFQLYSEKTECYANDFSPLSRTYFKQLRPQIFEIQVANDLFKFNQEQMFELNDYRFLMKLQLDKDGKHTRIQKGVNHIVEKIKKNKQHSINIINYINQKHLLNQMPERVFQHPLEKKLIENCISKIKRFVQK